MPRHQGEKSMRLENMGSASVPKTITCKSREWFSIHLKAARSALDPRDPPILPSCSSWHLVYCFNCKSERMLFLLFILNHFNLFCENFILVYYVFQTYSSYPYNSFEILQNPSQPSGFLWCVLGPSESTVSCPDS